MELHKAHQLALLLMAQHGIAQQGWTFSFDNASIRFGVCRGARKEISLSRKLTLVNDESAVKDTILHEIAHALVGCRHMHDEVWKAKAREIGCRPEQFYGEEVIKSPGSYTAECRSCKRTFTRIRKPGRHQSCGYCSGKNYNPAFQLVWSNGQESESSLDNVHRYTGQYSIQPAESMSGTTIRYYFVLTKDQE